jgi:hypothetical protein
MTGPEHYARAEELLTEAEELLQGDEPSAATWSVGQAQAHATLALAMATALKGTDHEDQAWIDAAGPRRG